jgi:hypothetical protein
VGKGGDYLATTNTAEVFELISELELYVSAIDRDIDNYDITLAIIADIRAKLEHLMNIMPQTSVIIMNYLDSIEERINERR